MIVIYTTFPDKASADSVTKKLLEEKLAACVQIFPIESTFWWKGKLEERQEIACFIKTKKALAEKATHVLSKNYPYEIPEIITINPNSVNKSYFDWIASSI